MFDVLVELCLLKVVCPEACYNTIAQNLRFSPSCS